MKRYRFAVACVFLPFGSAVASETNGDLSLGFVHAQGNSNTTTLNAKTNLDYRAAPWEDLFTASALRGDQSHVTTDEKYSLGNKLTYSFTEVDYTFWSSNYDEDRFGGIVRRYSSALGYGRRLIKTDTQLLELEAGLGFNHTHKQGEPDPEDNGMLTFGGKYVWKISDTTQFTQTLRTEIANNNTYVDPITELKLTVIGMLFATLNYEVRYNSQVPAGTVHTDQITTVNLGYTFGKKPL